MKKIICFGLCLLLFTFAYSIESDFVNNSNWLNNTFNLTFYIPVNSTGNVTYSLDNADNVSMDRIVNDWIYFNNNPIDQLNNGFNEYSYPVLEPTLFWKRKYSGIYADNSCWLGCGYYASISKQFRNIRHLFCYHDYHYNTRSNNGTVYMESDLNEHDD